MVNIKLRIISKTEKVGRKIMDTNVKSDLYEIMHG